MSQDDSDPRVGSVLQDRYRLDAALSSGAMGAVYRAERIGLGRQVAIKFLHPHFAEQPNFIKRFEHEALAMSKLNHPNCISVIDFGVDDSPFIVMDYVTGTTLLDVIDAGPIPPSRAVDIARQVLAGLAHAHNQGIIHRDIKPANIMLSDAMGAGEHVHILDFGLAKLRDADLSMSGIVVGTPSYMAPEQAAYKKLDGRSDVYSTGVLVFELLTGTKPFVADEGFEIIRHHLESAPPALRERCGGAFSEALESAVAKALAKSPDERHASALAFADALAVAVGEESAGEGSAAPHAARAASERELAEEPTAAASKTLAPLVGGSPAAATGLAATEIASEPATDAAVAGEEGLAAPESEAAEPRARKPGLGRRTLAGLLVVALAGWAVAGAPGLPSRWIDAAHTAFDSARAAVAAASSGEEGREASRATALDVESVEDARALADEGEIAAALRGLHELRRQRPDDAAILKLMGELYFERGWYEEGLTAFTEAVTTDPSYREHGAIAKRAAKALAREESRQSARVLLIKHMGEEALPELRKAAAEAESREAAAEIRDAVSEIERRADGE